MLDTNYIETGLDTCQYTIDGITTTAIIKEVTPHHLSVKPISRMGKNVYETNLDTTFIGQTFSSECYPYINLEIWSDGTRMQGNLFIPQDNVYSNQIKKLSTFTVTASFLFE